MLKKLDIGTSEIEQVEAFNALVDAVNELQKQIDNVSFAILDLATPDGKNKALKSIQADPYTEQRKWIGKLCWFYNIENKSLGILEKIDKSYAEDGEVQPYLDDTWTHYTRCEPVKPDDNIIFKGE